MATTNDSQLTDFLNYFNNTRITPNFTAAAADGHERDRHPDDRYGNIPRSVVSASATRNKSHHSDPLSQLQRPGRAPPWVRGKATTTARQHLRFSLLMGRSRV